MNYREMEQTLDRVFAEMEKSEEDERTMLTIRYCAMKEACQKLGLILDREKGKHILKSSVFVKIYKPKKGEADCKRCELRAVCQIKNDPIRLPNPEVPDSIGLCPKSTEWIGG